MGSWKPDYSKKQERAAPGPVPTLAELAQGSSWLWARCPERECLHCAAIPLHAAMAHFGGDVSSDRLRSALRCTACGHKGGLLQLPSWGMSEGFRETAPPDRIPPALHRLMARDALRDIGVEIRQCRSPIIAD